MEIGGVSTKTLVYAASLTPNCNDGEYQIIGALTGNITINAPTNSLTGRRLTFRFTQDGTGGRTVTWNAVFSVTNWTVNTAANAKTEATFTYDGSNWILALNPATVAGFPMAAAASGDTTGATDTGPLQTLLTAGGCTLQRGQTYYINASLTAPAGGFTLDMNAATIKYANGINGNGVFVISAGTGSGSVIKNGTVDCNVANNTGNNWGFRIRDATDIALLNLSIINSNSPISLVGTVAYDGRYLIDNVRMSGHKGRAVTIQFANKVTIRSCVIRNMTAGGSSSECIYLDTSTDCIVENNICGPGNNLTAGIAIHVLPSSHRAIVRGNRVIAGDDGIDINGSNYCVVSDNIVTADSPNSGGGVGLATTGGAQFATFEGNVVTGMPTNGGGIDLAAGSGTQIGHVWTGNVFQGNTSNGWAVGTSGANTGRHFVFANNVCRDNGGRGISIGSGGNTDIDDLLIEGNVCYNNTSGNFLLSGTVSPNVVVRGNLGINPIGNFAAPAVPATTVVLGNPKPYDSTVLVAGGTLTAIGLGGCPTPVNQTHVASGTGGTLANNTAFFYRVTALNAAGETIASTETSITTPVGANTCSVNVKWTPVSGATGYNVYGRTTAAEQKLASNVQTANFVDTGAVTPSGALPGADTTGNTATGITAAAAAGSVHSVRVPGGGAIKLTYTVAPTWTWFGD